VEDRPANERQAKAFLPWRGRTKESGARAIAPLFLCAHRSTELMQLLFVRLQNHVCVASPSREFEMAKKKSVLVQRVNELEDAVTRMFTGEPPAPAAKPRRKAKKAKKAGKAKKTARKAVKKAKKAARKAKRKARR
jgi:hypothetical protein